MRGPILRGPTSFRQVPSPSMSKAPRSVMLAKLAASIGLFFNSREALPRMLSPVSTWFVPPILDSLFRSDHKFFLLRLLLFLKNGQDVVEIKGAVMELVCE